MADDKLKSDSMHLEPLDLNSLDDYLVEPTDKKESAVRRFTTGFKRGFLEQTKTKVLVKRFLRSALPDGYSRAVTVMEDTADTLKEMGSDLEQTHYKELDTITRKMQDNLPKLKKKLGEKLYGQLESKLKDRREQYAMQREYSRNPEEARRQREQEADERAIREALDGAAESQIELALAQAEQHADERAQDAEERGLRDQIGKDRYDVLSRALSSIVVAQQKQVAFQDQVTYRYQRKGLELQFRSYMALRDMRKMAEVQMKMHQEAYMALVKNTGLPDHMKATRAENLKWNVAQRTNNAMINKFQNSIPGLLASFAPGLAQNAKNMAGGGIQQLAALLSGGEAVPLDMLRQQYQQNKAGFVGGMAGRGAGMLAQSVLLPLLGRKAKPKVTKFSDQYLKGSQNRLSYLFDNAPALTQEFANDPSQSNGWRGYAQKAARALAPQFQLNDRVANGNYQTIGQQSSFNQLTQRSIVEVIPGYLARLLQEARMARTGRSDVPMEVYDITRGEFTSKAQQQSNLTKKIVSGSSAKNMSWAINDTLNTFDKEGKLSGGARSALSERLLRDAATNKRFSAEGYASGEGYAAGTDAEVVKELEGFFKSKFKLDPTSGKMVNNTANNRRLNDYSQAFINIRAMSQDPIKEINRLLDTGNIGALREIGVVITTEGVDKINYNRLWELYREGVTSTNPNASGPDDYTDDGRPNPNGGGLGGDLKGQFNTATKNLRDKARNAGSAVSGAYASVTAKLAGMSTPNIKALLDRLPELPQVNKASLAAKLAKAKAGVKTTYSTAEQHLLDMLAGLPEFSMPSMPGMPSFNLGGIQGKFKPVTAAASELYGQHQPAMAKWHAQASAMASRAHGAIKEAMGTIEDAYIQGKNSPMIMAKDIRDGILVDVNTKKIITCLEDITGAVIDNHGDICLSASQFVKGLENANGDRFSLKAVTADVQSTSMALVTQAKARMNEPFTIEGEFSRVKDLYLEHVKEPVLLARDMAKGLYIDMNSDKVIETVDDITGPVLNAETQSIIVTADEVASGFTDVSGRMVSSSKMMRLAKRWMHLSTRPSVIAFKLLKAVTSGVVNFVGKRLFTQDAYLPGTESPVLTARGLRRGEYFDAEGKPLESFTDLRNGVFDRTGQAVVTAEDVRQLVNRDGSKHVAAKRKWAITKLAGRALRGAAKGYLNASKNYYKWLGGKIASPITKRLNRETGQMEDVVDEKKLDNPTDRLLNKINQTLNDRLPGKGPAKGSWQEKLAAEEAEDAALAKADRDKREERLHPKGGNLDALSKILKGKAGQDDDEHEGGDTNIDLGDRDSKGRPRKKPKTRLGKWMQKSKLGRGIAGAGRALGGLGKAGLIMGSEALLGTGATAAIGSGLTAAGGLIGGGLAGAASLAGAAVTGAGSLLLAAVTSPVLLGAAAAAAVGYGAYWLYSRNRDTSGDFRELRCLQYGSNSTSLSLKILEAEAIMEGVTSKSGTPDWSFDKDTAEKVMKAFGISKDEPAKIAALAQWMDLRMKPVLMAYVAAIANLAKGACLVDEIDDKFPEPMKPALLDAVKLPSGGDGPYGCLIDPTGDKDPLEVTPADIEKSFNALKDKLGSVSTNAGPKTTTALPVGTAAATIAGVNTARNGTVAQPSGTTGPVQGAQLLMNKPAANGGAVPALGGVSALALASFKGGIVSALQSIRLRAYGLDTVDEKNVTALFSAESYFYTGAVFDKDGKATWTGDPKQLLADMAPIFGISTDNPSAPDQVKFTQWLYYRFAPVFMAFLGAVHQQDASISTLDQIEAKLTPVQKVFAGNAVIAAQATMGGDKVSIWGVTNFFEAGVPAESLKQMAKADLLVLSQEAEKAKVATPTQSAQQQAAKAAAGSASAPAPEKSFTSSIMDSVKSAGSAIAQGAANAWQATKNWFGGGDKSDMPNAGAPYVAGQTPTFGGALQAQGNVYQGFTSGTGGQFEKIPLPTANKSREGAMPTLKAIEAMTGIDAELLATFCSIESGFDYLVKAGTSSATGWFQFIDGTWDAMIKKYGSKYGIPDDPSRALRKDPRVNGLMGAEFLKENYGILSKALGRAPTDVDLYCAHFFGPYGAVSFLKMDPNALASLALPKQAAANASIFYKAPGQPRTMREIYQLFEEKVSKHRKGGKGTNILLQTPGKTASPVDAANAQAAAVASGATNSDTPDPKMDTTQAAANDPSGGSAAPSATPVSQQAAASTFPLSSPGSGGPGVAVASGATPPTTDSTAPSDPQVGDDAATTAAKAAAKADKIKQAQTQDHMGMIKQGTDLQEKQLAATIEMRDYLKVIAQNLTSAPSAGGGSNGIDKSSSNPVVERAPGNRAAPIKMTN